MKNKTCMVTGATSGLGRATAFALANMGATLVVVGRNEQKTRQLTKRLHTETGNAKVEYLIADLENQSEIFNLSNQFMSRHHELHILINNAGAVFTKREETPEGFEKTFALNHLSSFLITSLHRYNEKKYSCQNHQCLLRCASHDKVHELERPAV